ncbi:MAG: hypothetical protein KC456_09740 [Flavobacteriales bacterium]|jgi:hypothetical protein|nr:hypothetical protein [Flavobacteriales bacterium]
MDENLNILAYSVYGGITAFIVFRVGWVFYVNGIHYILDVFKNENDLAQMVNRFLLIGYYLINLGYVAVSLSYWPAITAHHQLIELLAERTAFIVLGLALMHYMNMIWVPLAKRFFTNN